MQKAFITLLGLSGDYEMIKKLDFKQLAILSREANNRLALINLKENLENNVDGTNLLNTALEDVIFAFTKVGEGEMLLADELKDTLQKTREKLGGNFDPQDPKFISLKEELERLFSKKNLSEVSQQEMENNIEALKEINAKANELERTNQLLKLNMITMKSMSGCINPMEKDPLTESESDYLCVEWIKNKCR